MTLLICTAAVQDQDPYGDFTCQMGYTTAFHMGLSSGADIK
jgi:hypothetical protein